MSNDLLTHPFTLKFIENIIINPIGCYGLVGENGSGKLDLAKHLSKKLLNTEKLEINRNYIYLDGLSAGVEDIRSLQKKISYKSTENSNKRVVLISDFDMLGHESQNAMLKTLEEPPEDTLILITFSNRSNILDTVYSRIKAIEVKPITIDQAEQYYSNRYPTTDIKKAYLMSGGSVKIIDEILTNKQNHEIVKSIELAKSLLSKSRYEKLIIIDKINKSGDISLENVIGGLIKVLHATYLFALQKQQSASATQKLADKLKLCLETQTQIKSNANSKLLLTRLFLSL